MAYMKETLAKYKEEHPELSHKEAFSAVAALWGDADANPNKGKEKKSGDSKKPRDKKPKPPAKRARPTKADDDKADDDGDDNDGSDDDEGKP